MTDEIKAVLGTGKTLKIGEETWVIVERDIGVEFVDWITEIRQYGGNLYLSLATAVIDAGNAPEARICARLRMNLGVAQSLHAALGNVIADALKPVDKSKAN
ncbi:MULTISPECIES: hypothetical protein [unclassified Mesorhizobium]|uniref:hypothetical protein n=1 Tax=unclassified Mesorhizobium TaxID=325217 RepID=UPI001129652A|nr:MULTISPECIES: hypothetical protein [unclassified Mesorhizobium]TPJ38198.1 hypothetical protein FJ437_30965 [Mesorhizobium sp. B2-6-6]MCA0000972.1 hypothetical protein [Mesorhizobium sp. B264B2A]MCA0004721.1 hypothetical protein [Mesorhizobium sp. B264B1B]MCA0019080.1 hypothetical protein [Mesorhizobium sp. B264B1A]TPJ52552.1 hypothetical protein FJ462_33345 [Mesorhizobium sp. B2-6-7]